MQKVSQGSQKVFYQSFTNLVLSTFIEGFFCRKKNALFFSTLRSGSSPYKNL